MLGPIRLRFVGLLVAVAWFPATSVDSIAQDDVADLVEPTAAAEPDTTDPMKIEPATLRNDARRQPVRELAVVIDQHIADRWKASKVVPAQACDDATYLRRVMLDTTGRIPRVSEIRAFLADDSSDKRSRIVEQLLDSPGYARHYAIVWRKVMIPEAASDFQARYLMPGFEGWLNQRLNANTPYDELARELLTVPLNGSANAYSYQQGNFNPIAFYQAKQTKPENLAAASARVFLGVRLECAQCHDHPFDSWSREQFWSFTAFYSGIQRQRGSGNGVLASLRELFSKKKEGIRIPDTDTYVAAAYLDGTQPTDDSNPREVLAEWITAKENPYFARTAVNRMWGHLFGIGIVDPVDDFGKDNPPSHGELLDALAREFAAREFDLKFLIEAITTSKTYSLSSRLTHDSQLDSHLFARRAVKGMSAEQLYASLSIATGYRNDRNTDNPFAVDMNSEKARFQETFRNETDSPSERAMTILQTLAMMNGGLTTRATTLDRSRTLASVVDYPLFDARERVEALYLAVFSRKPQPEETARLVKYVSAPKTDAERRKAYANVFWALLNSSEFTTNH